MAGDKIYANRNTWTGSIGVKTGTLYDVRGLLDKLGIKTNTITSGRNKAMGSMTTELTDEQREGRMPTMTHASRESMVQRKRKAPKNCTIVVTKPGMSSVRRLTSVPTSLNKRLSTSPL